ARERVLLRHRVPDVEAEPQLGDQRGVGDVDPRIELDAHGPRVRSLPDAEPDFVKPRQDEPALRRRARSLTGDGGNAVAVARGGRRWVAQVPHEAVQPDIPRRRLEARQPFVGDLRRLRGRRRVVVARETAHDVATIVAYLHGHGTWGCRT